MDDDARSVQDCCQLAFHGRAEPAAKYQGGSIALLSAGLSDTAALRRSH